MRVARPLQAVKRGLPKAKQTLRKALRTLERISEDLGITKQGQKRGKRCQGLVSFGQKKGISAVYVIRNSVDDEPYHSALSNSSSYTISP